MALHNFLSIVTLNNVCSFTIFHKLCFDNSTTANPHFYFPVGGVIDNRLDYGIGEPNSNFGHIHIHSNTLGNSSVGWTGSKLLIWQPVEKKVN